MINCLKYLHVCSTFLVLFGPLSSFAETGNVITIDGTNRTVTANFGIGTTGSNNTLRVINGGVLDNMDGYIGLASSADRNLAQVTGTNSVWNSEDWSNGFAGSDNRVQISMGGRVNVEFQGYIGRSSGADNNQVVVGGASSKLNVGDTLYLGNAGKNNELIVSNEASVVVGSTLVVGDNVLSTGNRLIIDGGSVTIPNGTFRLGNQGEGTLQMDGGLLQTSQFFAEGGNRSQIQFNAGVIDAENLQASLGSPLVVGDGISSAILKLGDTSHMVDDEVRISVGSTLFGKGNLVGDLVSNGTVAPGDGTAVFTIFGSATLSASSVLAIDVNGLQAGPEHDQLVVNRTSTLAGNLSLRVGNVFRPAQANQMVIVRAQTLVGTFANAPEGGRIPSADGFGSFQVNYVNNTVVISGFIPSTPATIKIAAMRFVSANTLALDITGLVPNVIARIFTVSNLANDPLNNAIQVATFLPLSSNDTWSGAASGSYAVYLVIQEL